MEQLSAEIFLFIQRLSSLFIGFKLISEDRPSTFFLVKRNFSPSQKPVHLPLTRQLFYSRIHVLSDASALVEKSAYNVISISCHWPLRLTCLSSRVAVSQTRQRYGFSPCFYVDGDAHFTVIKQIGLMKHYFKKYYGSKIQEHQVANGYVRLQKQGFFRLRIWDRPKTEAAYSVSRFA